MTSQHAAMTRPGLAKPRDAQYRLGMVRMVLSLLLVFALSGAAAASVAHGVGHGDARTHVHGDMPHDPIDPTIAMENCCDSAGGMLAHPCLGDLAAVAGLGLRAPLTARVTVQPRMRGPFSSLSPSVPTGPPKI